MLLRITTPVDDPAGCGCPRPRPLAAPPTHAYDSRVLSRVAIDAIDAEAATMVARTGQPGLALALTDRDGVLFARTYGAADMATGATLSSETLFEIGSIGKSFTAVLVLQLAEAGRIDLTAPVDRYLPWFRVPQPAGAPPIAIEHLLTHTAGIVAGADATPEAAFQVWALRDTPARSAPGARYHYSNVGYKALGLVLEAVEGRRYPDLLRERILEPLGMRASEPAITNDIRARLAIGYEYLREDRLGYPGAPLAPATWLETDTADGSIASTAEDMCAFARMLLRNGDGPGGRLLSEAAFARMSAPHVITGDGSAYGYGLGIRELEGRRLIGHGGGMVGYRSALQADTAAGIAAVVLQNGPAAAPLTLARTAIDIALQRPRPPAATRVADVPSGRFDASDGTDASIELLEGHDPVLLRADRRTLALEQWDDGLFAVADPEWDRFPLEIAGTTTVPEIWHGDRRFLPPGADRPDEPEPTAALRTIVGSYRAHNPWAPQFRVVLRGRRPWLIFATPPDGFDTSQPLNATANGDFQCGDDPENPEHIGFDTVVDGRALRARLSGWPYYRVR
jgi:CubicO group peptidase (beta-lactamase class C family)